MNLKKIPSSKSLVNRYLILKEAHPILNLSWSSEAADVLFLKKSLSEYKYNSELYIGEGGTTLRFLSLYLSTKQGEWILKGVESLFSRPQDELLRVLRSLGAEATLTHDSLKIKSRGWSVNQVDVSVNKTTQVLTGVLLAALTRKREFKIKVLDKEKGSGYFKLTINFLKSLGFEILENNNFLEIKNKTIKAKSLHIEADWSTAAFLYVKAALEGEVFLDGLSKKSVQPDHVILKILEASGVCVDDFGVRKSLEYRAIHQDLKSCPDLFPVLSVFSCFCKGRSVLDGAPQLIYKETNRIKDMQALLDKCGYKTELLNGGLSIFGEGFKILKHDPFSFDVSKDHRMFMAAELLRGQGYEIEIIGKNSITKSFPDYLNGGF